jgi:hypothetical protein
MIGLGQAVGPLAAIPSEFSGLAKVAGCPTCRLVLMIVMNESGRATEPLEVHGYDLAESDRPGHWNLKGGWMLATPHRCGPRPGGDHDIVIT